MSEKIAFNVHADLYENRFGELAIKFPGQKVFSEVGTGPKSRFLAESRAMLETGEHPSAWREMPPHQLLYGQDWRLICRMGYLDGDEKRPALEPQVPLKTLGARAKAYLSEIAK